MSDPREAGFVWKQTSEIAGYWSLRLGDPTPRGNGAGDVEVCLEPTVFGHWLLAVYVDGELAHEGKLDLAVAAIAAGGPLLEFRS